jgi:hypothetical protein
MGAHTFHVREVPAEMITKRCGGKAAYAVFFPDTQEILVEAKRRGLSESLRLQSFYHELGHAVLWTANSRDYANERVVDAMGHALLQYQRTKDR